MPFLQAPMCHGPGAPPSAPAVAAHPVSAAAEGSRATGRAGSSRGVREASQVVGAGFGDVKERIKQRVDLVAVIEGYFPLRPKGRHLEALCPFHQEKSPSFMVFPDTQHFKCFGCSKGGDVYTFLMEREGLTFFEAMERLAVKAGISLDELRRERPEERSRRGAVLDALSVVSQYYSACLHGPAGAAAREYLARRGLADAIAPFGLGYAPAQSEPLVAFLRSRKVPLPLAVEGGVLVPRSDGSHTDRFRGRVIFPIQDEAERVVGFGGRILVSDPELPKYLNSPETPVFNKRRMLFGLSRARRAGHKRLCIMEGYTDVIASHLAGFTHAVATLGTSLTGEHARMLARVAPDGVVLLFDGDKAGIAAAERAIDGLATAELPVLVAILKGEKDPADLVQSSGREGLERILTAARPALEVKIDLVRARHDVRDDVGLAKALEDCLRLVAKSPNPVRQEAMLQALERSFHVPADGLRRKLATLPPPREERVGAEPMAAAAGSPARNATGRPEPQGAVLAAAEHPAETPANVRAQRAEAELLAALCKDPSLAAGVDPGLLPSAHGRRLLAQLVRMAQEGSPDPGRAAAAMFAVSNEDPSIACAVAGIVSLMDRIAHPADCLRQNVRSLARDAEQRTLGRFKSELRLAQEQGDQSLIHELNRKIFDQIRKTRQES
jgi:DNA primase